MLFSGSANSLRQKIVLSLLFVGAGMFFTRPCIAQQTDPETQVSADPSQDPPGNPEDPVDPVDPVEPTDPVSPLPFGESTEGIFVVGTSVYQTTLTAVDNLGVSEITLQIKKGTIGVGGITFETDILAVNQKVNASLVGNNILFISGKVAVAPAVAGAASPRKLISGVLYRESAEGPLKFKGVGFSNASKAFERLQQEAANEIPTSDPCAEDPDDLSLT